MGSAAVSIKSAVGVRVFDRKDAGEDLKLRHSSELILALAGPVGCGMNHVKRSLVEKLKEHGYTVVDVKISELLISFAGEIGEEYSESSASGEYSRIKGLQDLGNRLRDKVGRDIASQLVLRFISADRVARNPGRPIPEIKPGRVAYVIDQLKNPAEVNLLREIYGNLFYLVGVLTGYARRKQILSQNMSGPSAEELIDRDSSESSSTGQQLEKTLKLADFFVRNSSDNTKEISSPLERFVLLLHGQPGVTPTMIERGMHAAYSASLRSACLSRQVGAAILDKNGVLISTGCNDVPKSGGGLYEDSAQDEDHRCVFVQGGICFNDKYKDKLRVEIERILSESGLLKGGEAFSLSNKIRSSTRLKDLIEFSRAVHAEMDALISVARRGSGAVQGGVLFTTTYPCHNCARHIIAAGISAVYFVEPYGKSLAEDLHWDSIDHSSASDGKVAFLHFEGVSPLRFSSLFHAFESRKGEGGRANFIGVADAPKRSPELLDGYRDLEAKISKRVDDMINSFKDSVVPDASA